MLPQYHLGFLHYNLLYLVLRWMARAETNQEGRQVGNPRIDAAAAPWHCLAIIQRALGTIPRTDLSLFSLTFPNNNCLQKNWIKWRGNASFQVEMNHPRLELQRLYTSLGHTVLRVLFFSFGFSPLHSLEGFVRVIYWIIFCHKTQQCRKWQTVADSDGCKKANVAILLQSQQAPPPKIDSAVCKKGEKSCLPPLW